MTTRRVVGSAVNCITSFDFCFFSILLLFLLLRPAGAVFNSSGGGDDTLPGIRIPSHLGFDAGIAASSSDSPCHGNDFTSARNIVHVDGKPVPLKRHLGSRQRDSESMVRRDLSRIQTLHRRISERKNLDRISRLTSASGHNRRRSVLQKQFGSHTQASPMVGSLESGVSQGSGEYFLDVFVGTPPRHFSLILDTGSDLNWIQCVPCHDCFEQTGPHYDPSHSSSYRSISCTDRRCALVSSPDPPHACNHANQSCPYFYWYGDDSNTTGDLASEVFALDLEHDRRRVVENVLFGCGHWNRGLFHGAAGLLGLGRGPLSFTSQLRSSHGHAAFSYCLVDRNSNASVSGKLFLGEDKRLMDHPGLNFTALVSSGGENATDTFYYVGVKAIRVGDETLPIPAGTWEVRTEEDGGGGTIIDSGTTLSYFAEPAYGMIRDAFVRQMGDRHRRVERFPVLDPCYMISGGEVEVPDFAVVFKDGAEWNFPAENYFIRLEEEGVVCLAILPTPRSSVSILGNYQQQNFHVIYDINASRLGFAPADCAAL